MIPQMTFEALLETIRTKTCGPTLEIERDFTDEMIMQIANAIPQNSNLLNLTLHYPRLGLGVKVIGTEATEALINAIITRTSLVSLDLGLHLEKGGAEAIAILLQQSTTLHTLYLGSASALPIGRGHDRGHPSIGDTGVVVLATALNHNRKPVLETFCLRHNWFGKEGAEALGNALCKIPTFKNLTLLYCQIGSEGAKCLVPLFQHSETLENVNLLGNYIGDDGVVALINALNKNRNSNLSIWNLGSNDITKTGIIALATFLKHNPPLEALYLYENEFHKRADREDKGFVQELFRVFGPLVVAIGIVIGILQIAIPYAFPFNTSKIQALFTAVFIFTSISISYALPPILQRRRNNIEKKELTEAATEIVALANALTLNNTLKIFDLSHTDIRDAEAIEFAKALDPSNPNQQSALQSLNLQHTGIGDTAATAFARILPRNHSLISLDLSNNAIGSPGGKALLEALTHDSIWNTPLLHISLGNMYRSRPPRDPNQFDEQIEQIRDLLGRKFDFSQSDIVQRQTAQWGALSVVMASHRANPTSAIKESVLDQIPMIGKYMGFLFPPRRRITKPTVIPPQAPNTTNEPPSSELRRRKNHPRK